HARSGSGFLEKISSAAQSRRSRSPADGPGRCAMNPPAAPAVARANAPALAPETRVAWPKRTVATLANGLQVVLVESRTFPKITAQLYFRSGNAVVSHSAPGLAEITATVVRSR